MPRLESLEGDMDATLGCPAFYILCPILPMPYPDPSHVGSLIWVPQPCQCRALPLQLKTHFLGCPRRSSTSWGTAFKHKGPAVCSPGSWAQSYSDHIPLCGCWDLEHRALWISYRTQIPVPGALPKPHPPHRGARLITPTDPRMPRMGSLGLGCLDVQPRPLPIKLALGWSEVAPAQDQIGVPRGHSRVVDNLKPLPFLERQVSLCPRLIVIEGHEGGHSACSEDGRVRRPGPGWRRRALHSGGGGGSPTASPGAYFHLQRRWASAHVPCVYVSGTPVRARRRHVGLSRASERVHMMSPAGSR